MEGVTLVQIMIILYGNMFGDAVSTRTGIGTIVMYRKAQSIQQWPKACQVYDSVLNLLYCG